MNIPTPYLVFLGDAKDFKQAKTAFGLKEWRPELCAGQMKLDGCEVDLDLPYMLPHQAASTGVKTFLIGISPFSTTLPDSYVEVVAEAIRNGLHIANPLHGELPADLRILANRHGVNIYNFRHREESYPKATGEKRQGLRLLTVGTDCACGKKFTALSISRALNKRNILNTFRSTGQTGFLISQSGINNDTIQADFLSGAAEWLTPENKPWHLDIVEGQGALSHPSFGAGSLSLIYGTQPDYIVMCHEPGRKTHRGVKMELPDLTEEIRMVEMMAKRTNKNAKVVALSLFTRDASSAAVAESASIASDFNIPCFDPDDPWYFGDSFDKFVGTLEHDIRNVQMADSMIMNKHGAKYV